MNYRNHTDFKAFNKALVIKTVKQNGRPKIEPHRNGQLNFERLRKAKF